MLPTKAQLHPQHLLRRRAAAAAHRARERKSPVLFCFVQRVRVKSASAGEHHNYHTPRSPSLLHRA
jgi:hypothetical protein